MKPHDALQLELDGISTGVADAAELAAVAEQLHASAGDIRPSDRLLARRGAILGSVVPVAAPRRRPMLGWARAFALAAAVGSASAIGWVALAGSLGWLRSNLPAESIQPGASPSGPNVVPVESGQPAKSAGPAPTDRSPDFSTDAPGPVVPTASPDDDDGLDNRGDDNEGPSGGTPTPAPTPTPTSTDNSGPGGGSGSGGSGSGSDSGPGSSGSGSGSGSGSN